MPNEITDLRSDTVTKPTADLGDNTLGEDPTVIRLEQMLADTFGFTAGLFLPSGVMGNQLGLRLLVPPGQELLADADSHFLLYEDGGVAWHGGILTRTAVSENGLLDPAVLARNTASVCGASRSDWISPETPSIAAPTTERA
ncbi:beta-eliminating lyase-related protein [Streptomyces sp. NPDC056161]|uniref:beta-eliminating lyase-related protein n=1 Tax=Streptomyces sp. NPDC056161 TaxID=3345732 RepID=UPI0035DCE4ED